MFIDWQKLRHEWKTFSLAVVTVLVEGYDIFVASNLDYTPIVPVDWRPYVPFVVGVLFLALRQYRHFILTTVETKETVTTEKEVVTTTSAPESPDVRV